MTGKLLAAAGCMFVVACAMGGRKQAASPPTASASNEPGAVNRIELKAELDRLYDDVDAERMKAGLPEPAPWECEGDACGKPTPQALTPHPQKATDAACKPSNSDTCTTSCTLSDSICKNADRICELAEQLAPDTDAAAKCEKATSTCKKSHETCCSCL